MPALASPSGWDQRPRRLPGLPPAPPLVPAKRPRLRSRSALVIGPLEYVLRAGHPFPSAPLALDEQRLIKAEVEDLDSEFPRSQCFRNCQRFVMNLASPLVRYAEGFVMVGGLVDLHAWLSVNGKVVDLTLRRFPAEGESGDPDTGYRLAVLGEIPAGRIYRGMAFDTEPLSRLCLRRQSWGTLIDDWQNDFPLLRGKTLAEFADMARPAVQ